MSISINQSFIDQFSSGIHVLLQDKASATRGVFREEESKGEKHFFERLGSFTASEVTGPLQPTDLQDPSHSRRMATVKLYHSGTYLAEIDKLKLLIDPTSEYTMGLAYSHGRNFDDIVVDALIGDAYSGKTGSTAVSLPSAQKIAHGSSGLTVAKLNQAMRIMEADQVDIRDNLYLFVPATGKEDLLGDASNQITSFDFQDGKVLSSGKFPSFRGINIVHTEAIPAITVGTTFRAILCTSDAVKVAVGKNLEIKTAVRPDLNFGLQISTYMALGAVRMEEKRVVEIAYQ